MLPNFRAVLAAVAAAIALLVISFGLAASYRVAQENRTGSLQADLVQRGRAGVPASNEPRDVLPIEKLAPLEANPVQAVEVEEAPEISPIIVAVPQAEPLATEPMPVEPSAERTAEAPPDSPEPAAVAHVAPRAEPPMGGPLPEQAAVVHTTPPSHRVNHAAAKRKAKLEAVKKARAERAARIVREHRAAAKKARAAQVRAKQQAVGSFNNAPFGSFDNFGNSTFGAVTSGAPRPAVQSPARSDR